MDFKTDEQKIIEWAEGLEHSDPDWWRVALPNTIKRDQCSELEARRRLINQAIGSCEIDKYGVPSDIQWRGTESTHDRECKRCTVLATGGKLRYLGIHCFGLTKVARCWWEEDVEVCGDVEVPHNLHCWKCEVCGNEYTDDWFLS